ncbi:hypothetical protein TVAG_239510 [Trichomonas vaginalis G3]|uniref:Protein HGH1 N-terminal domain-containing protein n=1 Tax=Trichomonas vaginalis (strain ATCC PRA-98 / G3) TaxID=412133 RepID=A2DGH9_TRIV3|nr:armadillo (ARM) repeat-containing protein family [Trichomonas vaginalis G3]EAY20575.1 hypothetical protein TVAG_239510 [Trichomonas vaginalis G3]KAI5488231.1 armadillo (ARM) repeat-containing protein family [Trichomonas vaginalis G3]|eukprot:XP_001581561.1 hypothetical protein [Trichomonas vaginalis G3]
MDEYKNLTNEKRHLAENSEEEEHEEEEDIIEFDAETYYTAIQNIITPENSEIFAESIYIVSVCTKIEDAAIEFLKYKVDNASILKYLLKMLQNDLEIQTILSIFQIFTNCVILGDCANEFYDSDLYLVISTLMHSDLQGDRQGIADFINEHIEFTNEILHFLNALSSQEIPEENINSCRIFWSDLLKFPVISLETEIEMLNSNSFEIIYNILNSKAKLSTSIIYNGFVRIAFHRLAQFSTDFDRSYICLRFLMEDDPLNTTEEFPEDWLQVFGTFLTEDHDFNQINKILKIIYHATKHPLLRKNMKEADYINLLIQYSENSNFKNRAISLKILLCLLNDPNDPMLVNFIIDQGNLEFLLPFLEVENQKINKIIVFQLLEIIKYFDENVELLDAILNSEEVLNYIQEIADLDEDESSSPQMIEAAYMIMEEIRARVEKE